MKNENLTREYIIKAFGQLLKEQNYSQISVCDICDKAGVSRMSFYRNFESKEDLVLKGMESLTKRLCDRICSLEVKNQYNIIKLVFETIGTYKPIIKSFENTQIFKTIIQSGIKKLEKDIPIDFVNKTSKYIPVFYYGALSLVLMNWLNNGANETPDEMARLVCSLIKDDIFKR